jgi:antitoxin MazE
MSTVVRTKIIKIGNSQGIRIPKTLLEQSGINTEVEIEVEGDHLTIRTAPQVRSGWDEAFALAAMAEPQDDGLFDPELGLTEWEQTEWQW